MVVDQDVSNHDPLSTAVRLISVFKVLDNPFFRVLFGGVNWEIFIILAVPLTDLVVTNSFVSYPLSRLP